MFVKLGGDKWVNTGNVCSIEKEVRKDWEDTSILVRKPPRIVYVVWFVGDNNKMVLNETQGRELIQAVDKQAMEEHITQMLGAIP